MLRTSYIIKASAPGFSEGSRTTLPIVAGANNVGDINLIPAAPAQFTVTGKVVNPMMQGVQGIKVRITNGLSSIGTEAVTDAAGNYTFSNLAAGQYRFEANMDLANPSYGSNSIQQTVGSGSTSLMDISLPATAVTSGVINGMVRGANGQVLSGVSITVSGLAYGNATTDMNGNFVINNLAPGSYTLSIPVFTQGTMAYSPYNHPTQIAITAASPSQNVQIQLSAMNQGANLSGRVKNVNGMMLSNVTVNASNTTGGWFMGTTNAAGDFTINNLQPGTYNLNIPAFMNNGINYPAYTHPTQITIAAGTAAQFVEILLGSQNQGSINGRVKNVNGMMLSNVTVNASNSTGGSGQGTTNAAGDFTINNLQPGTYNLNIPAFENNGINYPAYTHPTQITIVAGTAAQFVEIQLGSQSQGTIKGNVMGANGQMLSNVNINVMSTTGTGGGTAMSDMTGNFVIANLMPGIYSLTIPAYMQNGVSYQPYNHPQPISITATMPSQFVQINLVSQNQGNLIKGKVMGANGQIITGIQVNAMSATVMPGGGSAPTDMNGEFIINNLQPGSYKLNTPVHMQNGTNYPAYFHPEIITIPSTTATAYIIIQLPAQPQGASISGRVTDATGKGLEGVNVNANNLYGMGGGGAKTDAAGNYKISGLMNAGSYNVNFDPVPYNQQNGTAYIPQQKTGVMVTANMETPNINVTMSAGGSISGRVSDGTGKGLEGIEVRANIPYSTMPMSGGTVYTDATGNYKIPGLSQGTYTVVFDPFKVNAQAGLMLKQQQKIGVAVSQGTDTPNVDITMSLGAMISGKVTDANGKGLAGIMVNANNPYGMGGFGTQTDVNGLYKIMNLTAGTYNVNFEPGQYNMQNNTNLQFVQKMGIVVYQDKQITLDMVMGQGGSISGQVTDANNLGMEGIMVHVQVTSAMQGVAPGKTDAMGNYKITGLNSGSYTLNFDPSQYNMTKGTNLQPKQKIGVVVVQGIETPNINMQMTQGGVISGRISDETGKGLAGVMVSANMPYSTMGGGAKTDATGGYKIVGLNAGNYNLFVDPSEYNMTNNTSYPTQQKTGINVIFGQPTIIDLVLSQGGSISGQIMDSNGMGMKGIQIYAKSVNMTTAIKPTVSDENGKYNLSGLSSDTYTLNFDPYQYNMNNGTNLQPQQKIGIMVYQGKETMGINIQMSQGGVISGKVSDTTGKGIPGVKVTANIPYSTLGGGSAQTDAEGLYKISGLNTGSYTVNFDPAQYNAQSGTIYKPVQKPGVMVVQGKETSNISIQLSQGGSIIGKVTDATGQGMAGVMVHVNLTSAMMAVAPVQTDQSGAYKLTGLSAGSYTLIFEPGQYNMMYGTNYQPQKMMNIYVTQGLETPNIDMKMSLGASISGKITDSAGKAMPGIKVYANIPFGTGGGSAGTDEQGLFKITGLTPGSYTLNIDPARYNAENGTAFVPQQKASVAVAQGLETANIMIQLNQGGSISGIVADTSGKGLEGIYVYAKSTDAMSGGSGKTDATGRYKLTGLGTGNYTLNFDPIQYNMMYNTDYTLIQKTGIIVTLGMETPNNNAQMGQGGGISGAVTDSSGKGMAGVYVYTKNFDTTMGSGTGAQTNYEGKYVLNGLEAGTYSVYFDLYQYNLNNATNYMPKQKTGVVVIKGKETPNTNISYTQGSGISGRVTDEAGKPLQGILVYGNPSNILQANGAYGEGIFTPVKAQTDSNGEYTLSGLSAGSYLVQFDPNLYNYDNKTNLLPVKKPDIKVSAGLLTQDINAQLKASTLAGVIELVSLNKYYTTIKLGAAETLTALISPTDAMDKTLVWKSSNPGIATVDGSGKVMGIAAGVTTITVATPDGSKSATCKVTVTGTVATSQTLKQNIALDKEWKIRFNQALDVSTLQENIIVRRTDVAFADDVLVPVTPVLDPNNLGIVVIKHATPFIAGATYEVTLNAGIRAANGTFLSVPNSFMFKTV